MSRVRAATSIRTPLPASTGRPGWFCAGCHRACSQTSVLARRPPRERRSRYTRDKAAADARSPAGSLLGDFEAGLAEKPDHVVAKFANRVVARRGHEQMVHQRTAEHVG